MKFITVRDLRSSPAKVWKDLPVEKEMIVTNNGKPVALLTPVSDQNMESTLRAVRQAMAASAIEKLQLDARKNGTNRLSDEDVEREIAETRAIDKDQR
jgi:antitoxin (DNA-binding transcriptional repressor) of toxin-antitoxin stability system